MIPIWCTSAKKHSSTKRFPGPRAKERSWSELIATIEEDPWGALEREVLDGLLDSLFPRGEVLPYINWDRGFVWRDEWEVTSAEVRWAIREKRRANTAPGPDGISAAILRRLPPVMVDRLARCFTSCLIRGRFPNQWKIAKLVLIPKGGTQVPNAHLAPQ